MGPRHGVDQIASTRTPTDQRQSAGHESQLCRPSRESTPLVIGWARWKVAHQKTRVEYITPRVLYSKYASISEQICAHLITYLGPMACSSWFNTIEQFHLRGKVRSVCQVLYEIHLLPPKFDLLCMIHWFSGWDMGTLWCKESVAGGNSDGSTWLDGLKGHKHHKGPSNLPVPHIFPISTLCTYNLIIYTHKHH